MKSTRRHELHENVLGVELGKTVDFLKKHGTKILWGCMLVATVLLVIFWYTSSRSQKRIGIELQYAKLKAQQTEGFSVSSDAVLAAFKAIAQQRHVERVAAFACVDVGDICAMRMLTAQMQSERNSFAAEAEKYYRKAITDHREHALAVAKAHLGLAKLAEGRREFETAEKEYRAVTAIAGLDGQLVVQHAMAGLQNLPKFSEPVKMATTVPATQPSAKGTSDTK